MMRKKLAVCVISAVCISMSVSAGVWAASVTENQAKEKVRPYLPEGTEFSRIRPDDGNYQLNYYNDAKAESYEYEVDTSTGAIISFESKKYDHRGGTKATITEDAASKKVTGELADAEILSVYLDRDDDVEYEVKFRTSSSYGEYTIHPETGIILERDIKMGTRRQDVADNTIISRERAIELAKQQVEGAVVADVDLDWNGKNYCYEIELYKNHVEYEVWILASSGEVLSVRSEQGTHGQKTAEASTGDIGREKAKSIALDKVPGGVVRSCERDYDDGRLVYEVEVRDGRWEHDFEIDGSTGQILEWDKDYDD